jgi:hypothetical protein
MDVSEAGAAPPAPTSLQQNDATETSRNSEAFLELTWIRDDRLIKSDVARAMLAALLGLMLFTAIRWGGALLND